VYSYWPTRPWPNEKWLPPVDMAHDLLLIGMKDAQTGRPTFAPMKIGFRGRGCGGVVKKFGEKSLIVAKARFIHCGYNYLLEW